MTKAKKITLVLAIILLPVICMFGIFSLQKKDDLYDTTLLVTDGVVNLVSGEFYGTNVYDSESGFEFLDTVKESYGFKSAKETFIFDKIVESSTCSIFKYIQIKNGIEVYGRGLSVVTDFNHRVLSISGNYKSTNAEIYNVDLEKIKEEVIENINIDEIYSLKLVVYNQNEEVDNLSLLINCLHNNNMVDMIVDATTFEIYQMASSSSNMNSLTGYSKVDDKTFEKLNSDGEKVRVNIETWQNNFSSNQVYVFADSSKSLYMCYMADGKTINDSNFFEFVTLDSADNFTLDDQSVIDAYGNLIECYNYYASGVLGTTITGLKNEAGKPVKLYAVVHAKEKLDKSYDNAAYWLPYTTSSYAYFLFGDGGNYTSEFSGSLDIVGHEYQHGITAGICNLEYLNEAGAINEAISDIFGAIIEGHDISSNEFWLMGEDVMDTYNFKKFAAIRDMKNPKNDKLLPVCDPKDVTKEIQYPTHIDEMYPLCLEEDCNHDYDDYGGVHINSNILTYATYKMYSYAPSIFTTEVIGKLWYNTLTRLSKTSTFADFRIQMLSSASALGYSEETIELINRGFADVGIMGDGVIFDVYFYENEEDANNGENLITSQVGVYNTNITLPSPGVSQDNKVFYYWTDYEGNKYFAGDEFKIPYQDTVLWAVYVDASNMNGWDVTIQGSGTDVDPYLIYSATELVYLSYLLTQTSTYSTYASAEYQLMSDIYLNDVEFMGLGTSEQYPFSGSFSGSNHSIYGLNLSAQTGDYAGFFGVLTGSVYNLGIEIDSSYSSTTSNTTYTGAIAGKCTGGISNCYSRLSIKTNGTVGGLVGLLSHPYGNNVISNSYSEGNLSGQVVGGLVGDAVCNKPSGLNVILSSYIGNCYSIGNLQGNIVGGIAGRANGFYFVNCMVTSEISYIDTASDKILGGVVGILMNEPVNGAEEGSNACAAGILSCKVASNIAISDTAGMLIGQLFSVSDNGKVIIENNTVKVCDVTKDVGNYSNLNDTQKINLVYESSKFSRDGVFEGAFDFDNPDFYTNVNNWSITRSVSLYNLESIWSVSKNKQMPKIVSYEFWISYAAESFSGGRGTVANPYQIGSAEELARLAALLSSNKYYSYSEASYILTNDIDLSGKIWTGIGFSIDKHSVDTNKSTGEITYYGFNGSFDGNGHTITGMNAVSVYSVYEDEKDENYYYVYEYGSALFGLVSTTYYKQSTYNSSVNNVIIKDLNMENVSVSGAYAAAVVSKALCSTNISNVKVHSGNINGSYVAGGIISVAGDSSYFAYTPSNITISGVLNNARIAGRIVGGIVGVSGNISFYQQAGSAQLSLSVINSVNRGKLLGFGDEIYGCSYDDETGDIITYYHQTILGGVIGLISNATTNLINNIFVGNIEVYTNGTAGGLIGATSYEQYNSTGEINIISSHNKLTGTIIFKFASGEYSYIGNYLGAVLSNALSSTIINDNNTISNLNVNLVGKAEEEYSSNIITIYSAGEVNLSSAYDYDNLSYYSVEASNFDSAHSWSEKNIENMLIRVVFLDHDNTAVGSPHYLEYGSIITDDIVPTEVLLRESDAKYHYTHNGWNYNNGEVLRANKIVYANYDKELRSYNVVYKLSDGTVIKSINQDYGTKISQEVKAPAKTGNFFIGYEFSHWKFTGSSVTGEMEGIAIYDIVIGKDFLTILVIGVAILFVISIIVKNVKKRKQQSQQ